MLSVVKVGTHSTLAADDRTKQSFSLGEGKKEEDIDGYLGKPSYFQLMQGKSKGILIWAPHRASTKHHSIVNFLEIFYLDSFLPPGPFTSFVLLCLEVCSAAYKTGHSMVSPRKDASVHSKNCWQILYARGKSLR